MNLQVLIDQVNRQFGYLMAQHGFVITHHEYHSEHFGNALVVLTSEDCRLRVILERGEVTVEAGPVIAPVLWSTYTPDLWFDIRYVIDLLTNGTVKWQNTSNNVGANYDAIVEEQIEIVADKVFPYIDQICQIFRADVFENTQRDLLALQNRRTREWLDKYSR